MEKPTQFALSDDTKELLAENALEPFIAEVEDLCDIVKSVDENRPPKPKELQQQIKALEDALEATVLAMDNLSDHACMLLMFNAAELKINSVLAEFKDSAKFMSGVATLTSIEAKPRGGRPKELAARMLASRLLEICDKSGTPATTSIGSPYMIVVERLFEDILPSRGQEAYRRHAETALRSRRTKPY